MVNGRKVALMLTLFFLLAAGAAYIAGRVFFQNRFFPGTTLNGKDCSFMRWQEAEGLINREIQTWALAVDTMNNGREAITAFDIGMGYDSDGTVEHAMEAQDLDLWFTHLAEHNEIDADSAIRISDVMVELAVDGLDCMQPENVVYPTDAFIVAEDDDTYTVVPEVIGNALDREKVIGLVRDAALSWQTEIDLEAEGCYLKPDIYSDSPQITQSLENVDHFKEAWITYDFADRTETLDWSTIKDWVITDSEGYMVLDENKVRDYVKTLCEKYNTFGKDRDFLTYDNRTIHIKGGDYGWLIDELKETQALMHAIEEGTVDVREPVYAFTAGSRSSANDLGMTYIEIDLNAQRLIYYQEGKPVVETDIVSGSPQDTNMMTPTGIFGVTDKKTATEILDSGNYYSVNYLLEFYYDDCICDAPWRTEFGYDENFWEGTDGSVELPTDAMAQLYSYVDVGTPVVIYDY